jgi:hypothetical protein
MNPGDIKRLFLMAESGKITYLENFAPKVITI